MSFLTIKWHEYISYDVKNKIAKSTNFLYDCRPYLDMYTISVFPFLNYGIEIWDTSKKIHIELQYELQMKITGIISYCI